MPYAARRGEAGRRAIACLGLMTSLVAVGCSDSRGIDPTDADGAAGSDGGNTGEGGRGDALPPPSNWKAVPVEGNLCRDGSATGYGINVNPASTKLLIFMEGGGACFNAISCLQNPDSWAPTDTQLNTSITRNWILGRTNDDNPFRDWNFIYIPYCSGDVHTGTAMSGYLGQPQVGFLNYKRDLAEVVARFPGVDQVVLGGVSAGGFGVAWNWSWTQDAFGSVPVYALDDSGPPMGPDYLPACQQQRYGALWGWANGSIHSSCTTCDVPAGNVVRPIVDATLKTYNSTRLGLLSYDEDGTIKSFFGYGLNNCADWESMQPPTFPTGKYPMGLAELRQEWSPYSQVGMYVVTGGSHTFLGTDIASVKTGASIPMLEWIKRLIDKSDGWSSVAP